MLVTTSTFKRTMAFIMLAVLLAFVIVPVVGEVTAYADSTTNSGVGGVDVKVDSSGNLTVDMGGFNSTNKGDAWNKFIEKYRYFIAGVAGVGAVTMVVFFIINFLKLGGTVGNPSARSQALAGCLWTGIAAALLGSVSFVVGFFYNALG